MMRDGRQTAPLSAAQPVENVRQMSRHYLMPGRVTSIADGWRRARTLTEKGVADNIGETPSRVVSAVLREHDAELAELRAILARITRRAA